ncbi:MAG: DNA adenine methylase [Clostridia bacterium]|jgi:DNA adenine methylase|nr:DNA adenine methylase [Clostridia bacterium]MEE1126392.1 DNA adenine methylase [Acutalibacteraceae bacterium]
MAKAQYMSASEAAKRWNISHRRVITLCQENRIPNVTMVGNMWIIPIDASKPVDGRTLRYDDKNPAKPFIKWAGGKGQLLLTFRRFYPAELGVSIKRYCEPMVGAGAVLFDILNNYDMDEVYICDTNIELINLYRTVKNNVASLIEILSELEKEHIKRDSENRKLYYIQQRNKYNSLIQNRTDENALIRAGLFVYLNKTCFNGLYRVNKKGLFNVPAGTYKNPKICDRENLNKTSELLQNVTILSGDYSEIKKYIDKNTFVYFDPPYRPLTDTAEFTAYNAKQFDDKEQIRLANFIKAINYAKVMESNSDPKNVNENDNFFDDLYKGFEINRISASRAINSKASARGKINEILITNYEV